MGSPIQRPPPQKWLFTEEEMRNTASMREGMSREEELTNRQMAAAFIQEMVDGLNMIRDPSMRIGHTGLCAAHIHMHRFYYWHSFQKFDYRDVGAACILLAGKTHECPRKLRFVMSVWRDKNDRKQLKTEAAEAEATQIIVLLESMILQTIAFDLNIELPHKKILDIMKQVEKDGRNKALVTCAYYFATDVLAVTDWCLRYSCASITIAVIQISAVYANIKIESIFSNFTPKVSSWYTQFDKTMTDEKLRRMQLDFLNTYQTTCTFHHASIHIADLRNESSDLMARKMDRGRDARSNSPMIHHNVPDSTVNGVRPRPYVPKDELTVERLNKERVHEEERRKRDHDRMSGRIDNSSSSEKRARIDPISANFVSSSSSSSTNGKYMAPPPPTSSNSKNSSNRKPLEKPQVVNSTVLSPFRHSARTFDVAPMLTPPIAPKLASAENSDMDLEDGELE